MNAAFTIPYYTYYLSAPITQYFHDDIFKINVNGGLQIVFDVNLWYMFVMMIIAQTILVD